MSPSSSRDRLERYRAKRRASATPEPFGRGAARPDPTPVRAPRLFVFHKHHARNLHWDLRLEWDGVLLSWAVPKGPSPNPADKRLAVHVEDHPLEYAEFEGIIPEGEYGAGPSIVWDRGAWVPLEDPDAGMEKGKLLFELRGHKVRGVWTLVHTPRSGENHWLLIKERDGLESDLGTDSYPDESIYSGLTTEQLRDPEARVREVRARAQALGARSRALRAGDVKPMLAETREEPFTRKGWVFEIKYDGYRVLAGRDGGEARLVSRNGGDLTATFPEVARAVRGLPLDALVLDGEVVVHDEAGLPSFGRLQRRGRLQREPDVLRASVELPATYYAFDLLGVEGYDLRGVPLLERKALLRDVLPRVGPIRFSDHVSEQGEAMYEQVTAMGLEGIVAKKADGAYRAGRSAEWIKVRALRSDDFVVVGWTAPRGSRSGFGALHVGLYAGPEAGGAGRSLVYRGSVGSGFDEGQLRRTLPLLESLERPDPAFEGGPPPGKGNRWVEPRLVAEVRYREVTEQGLLRHPVFLRFRDDKEPEECVEREDPSEEALTEPEPAPRAGAASPVQAPASREVRFTNLDKVFWPEEGYTKGDLVEYHRRVSPWLLPYLRGRPLVLTRYPDGIHGKSFYQKDAPDWAPDWIRTVTVWSDSSERELEYFVCDDEESLLYIVNMGTIPLHIWSSRVESLSQPDWCVLDLDPKDAPFAHVVEVARTLRKLCQEIGLPSFVKTSGSTGLHVLVPLGRQCSYGQSRTLGELLARVVVGALPEICTITRAVRRREGKVYIDYLQNRHGQLIVAPFSVRPVPEAAVSAPLRWSEVNAKLDIRKHTIRTVPRRMKARKGGDPMAPVLDMRPDLVAALERLAERLE